MLRLRKPHFPLRATVGPFQANNGALQPVELFEIFIQIARSRSNRLWGPGQGIWSPAALLTIALPDPFTPFSSHANLTMVNRNDSPWRVQEIERRLRFTYSS